MESEPVAVRRPVCSKIVSPVQRNRIDVQRSNQPVEVHFFGVVNERYASLCSLPEHLNGALGCRQGDGSIVVHRKEPRPRVEELNGVRSTVVHLIGQQRQRLQPFASAGARRPLGRRNLGLVLWTLVARAAGHQIQAGRPGASCEAETGDVGTFLADGSEGVGGPRCVLAC